MVAVLARRGVERPRRGPPRRPPSAAPRRPGARRRRAPAASCRWTLAPPACALRSCTSSAPPGPPARPAGAEQVVDGAVRDGVLVEAELGVLGDLGVGGRVLAGLQVDHHDPAVVVDLEPVGVAVEPRPAGRRAASPRRAAAARWRARAGARARRARRRSAASAARPPRARARRDHGVRNAMRPQTASTCAISSSSLARGRRPASSPLAIRSARACTTEPEALGRGGRRLAARLALEEPLGRAGQQRVERARRERDRLVGPVARASAQTLRARVPHQVAGSACGTSGRPRRGGGASTREPVGGRRAAGAGGAAGSASGARAARRPGRPATAAAAGGPAGGVPRARRPPRGSSATKREGCSPSSSGDATAVTTSRCAGPGAGDVEQPALLGEQRLRGRAAAAGRRRRSGRPAAACRAGAGRASPPPGRARPPRTATPGPWSGGR